MLFRFADRRGEKSISKIDFSNTMNALGLSKDKDSFRADKIGNNEAGVPHR